MYDRHSPEYVSARSAPPTTLGVHAVLGCDRQVARRNMERDIVRQIELRHVVTQDAGIVGPGARHVVVPGNHDALCVENRYSAAITTFHACDVNLSTSLGQQASSPVRAVMRIEVGIRGGGKGPVSATLAAFERGSFMGCGRSSMSRVSHLSQRTTGAPTHSIYVHEALRSAVKEG
jgi:hypothetical protein